MKNVEIFISGVRMDVDNRFSKIATTRQHFNFLNIGSINASRTNRIKLPLTPTNKEALGQIEPINNNSSIAYSQYPIIIVQDSIEEINGVCQIIESSDAIYLDVQSNVKDFWDKISNAFLHDLDLSFLNDAWTAVFIDSKRNTTSGVVVPIIDNGDNFILNISQWQCSDINSMQPFIYYSTIMDALFAYSGYTKSGGVFSDTNRYSKMAVMCTAKYPNAYYEAKKVSAFTTGNTTFTHSGSGAREFIKITNFTSYAAASDDNFNLTADAYEFKNGVVTALNECRITFRLRGRVSSSTFSNGFVGVSFYKNGAVETIVDAEYRSYYSFFQSNSNFAQIDMKLGDQVTFYLNGISTVAGQQFTVADFYMEAFAMTPDVEKFYATPLPIGLPTQVQNGNINQYGKLLPAVSLRNFITDFMKMFGLAVREGGDKIIEFRSLTEVINSTPSSELSKENKSLVPKTTFEPDGYSKNNYFTYESSRIEELLGKPVSNINNSLGKGNLQVNLNRLPAEQDLYQSIWVATEPSNFCENIDVASFKSYDRFGLAPLYSRHRNEFGNRLVMIRNNQTSTPFNISEGGGGLRTDWKVAVFTAPAEAYDLSWSTLLRDHYVEYKDVLNKYLEVEQEFFLTKQDFLSMNLLTPKTYKGTNFIIERISDHVEGRFAKVKLIRI